MIWTLLVGAALLGAANFEATTLDGRTAKGPLVELNAQRVVLETALGPETFSLESLATLTRADSDTSAAEKATLWVELIDESGLAAAQYTVDGHEARVTLTGGAKLALPTRAIRWVRFSPPLARDERLASQWAEIAKTSAGGDLLVVRKNEQLDYLEGVVGDVSADTCRFEIDDEVIPVKRANVEGIVYFHPAPAELADAEGRISTRDGSRIVIATATLGDGRLAIATPSGVSLSLPLGELTRLDFTIGKIAYLSDLEPASATYVPFFGFQQDLPVLSAFYGYRRDVGFENSPLVLDGKTYRKGLALQSRTVLSYRLPRKFRALKATVGIDDDVRATGTARLQIVADGKTVWEGDVRGTEPAQRLDLDISGARRLDIIADYGDEQDVGDRIILGDARVTK